MGELMASQVKLEQGQTELERSQARMEDKVDALQTDVGDLKEDMGRVEKRLGRVEKRLGRVETDVAEVKMDVGELLAPRLEDKAVQWCKRHFRTQWSREVNHFAGQIPQWSPSLKLTGLWRDGMQTDEWSEFREAAGLPEAVRMEPEGKRCDIYACYAVRLPDGTPARFLLIGEASMTAHDNDFGRFRGWHRKLRAHTDLPILFCLFTNAHHADDLFLRQCDHYGLDPRHVLRLRREAQERKYFQTDQSLDESMLALLPALGAWAIRPKPAVEDDERESDPFWRD